MQEADVPFGLELCRIAGWNQVEADWRHLLEVEPEGVFVAETGEGPCATGSAVAYGDRVGWIGMILVHPAARRRGVATALMDRCIAYLEGRGVESIKLDATDEGRAVYRDLGFRDERPVHRYVGAVSGGSEAGGGLRPLNDADWPKIAKLDRRAFGADRLRLLRLLARDGKALAAGKAGDPTACGFLRTGHEAALLGPVVSENAETAARVVDGLLVEATAPRVYWDVLVDNAAARDAAERRGFRAARRLTRMVRGEKMNPGTVEAVYATAGFELG